MPHYLRQHLLSSLKRLSEASHYRIAFSGGLDSTVLLHLMSELGPELEAGVTAVHIDHGLSAHSADWSRRCVEVGERFGVKVEVRAVSVTGTKGEGLEAAARKARYAAFEQLLQPGEVLLMAHHRDDQAETLLLQLMRGGGVHGLAGMPSCRPLAKGWLGRPLLDQGRDALRGYAEAHELEWIDDPSNFDTSLERNYLRHELLPSLGERRAGIRQVLARSAGHFAESARLLDELAKMDRQAAMGEHGRLSVTALRALPPERCRNLLRFHLRCLGLPLPQHRQLQQVLEELLPAAEDAVPRVAWPGAELRRYRDELYCLPPLPAVTGLPVRLSWQGEKQLKLPDGWGRMVAERRIASGISAAKLEAGECELRRRTGGEALQPPGRSGHHALKKLFQEAGVPPWERERLPLLFLNGQLAQVPGYWTAVEFAAGEKEEGILFDWWP